MMDDILDGDEELSGEADEMLDSVFESIGLDVASSVTIVFLLFCFVCF